ncbi:MAG: CoB--CoM heterodisulfide reductase iron-sulfur subunit A family protein [Candidatus Bathyarchaeia archaeon]|jgi:heterodisulfide reductase subunit A
MTEKPRIGVYICHCGLNIAATVDAKAVAEFAKTLPDVVVSKDYKYTCSDPGQEMIKKDVKEQKLNRVIVAACSPRMHEPTYRKLMEQAGLNPYLFEMVNIREQSSWVHMKEPAKATQKAKELVSMAVARSRLLEPLEVKEVPALKSVLVIGGGIAGIQSALDLAEQDYKVCLVERQPTIGGHMAQLDKTFPTMDCSICIFAPKMVDVAKNPNVTLLTNSEVQEVSGVAGNFHVKVLKKARFVNEKKCVGCGVCASKCPVKTPNEFDMNLGMRKAVYIPFPQGVPAIYTIDKEHCLYFTKGVCKLCEKFCEAKAIDYEQKDQIVELDVGAVIVATGFEPFDPSTLKEFQYGKYKNVVTSLDFERLISAFGPQEGKLLRPSDGKEPHRIAFIQCVGSRDERTGNIYCSNICCMSAIKQAVLIKEKHPEYEVYIFYNDIRAFGKGFEEFYQRARDLWVTFVKGIPAELTEDPETKNLTVRVVDLVLGKMVEVDLDMVILSIGMIPPKGIADLTRILRIPRGADGFLLETHPKLRPVDTPTMGVFLAGACQGPKDIPASVAQAKAAASGVASLLSKGKIRTESSIAVVNEDFCSGCRVCVSLCKYDAIKMEEKKGKQVASVSEITCMGCGVCASACPTKSISLRHFTDQQILAQIRALAPEASNCTGKTEPIKIQEEA